MADPTPELLIGSVPEFLDFERLKVMLMLPVQMAHFESAARQAGTGAPTGQTQNRRPGRRQDVPEVYSISVRPNPGLLRLTSKTCAHTDKGKGKGQGKGRHLL